MKKYLASLCILLFFSKWILAQSIEISPTSITFFEDTSGVLTKNEALISNYFSSKYEFPKLLTSQYKSSFWVKCELINSGQSAQNLLFTAGNFKSSTLYIYKNSRLLVSKFTSKELEPNQRPYYFDYKYFPLQIEAGDTLLLLQKINDEPRHDFEIKPKIVSPEKEAQIRLKLLYEHEPLIRHNNSMIAILLFVPVFILIFYYFFRKSFLLYYFFYLISFAAFAMYGQVYSPFANHILGASNFLKFTLTQNFYFLCSNLAYIYFVWNILEGDKLGKKWQIKLIKFVKGYILALLVFEILIKVIFTRLDVEYHFFLFSKISLGLIGLCTTFIICTEAAFRKNRFIIAGTCMVTLALIYGVLSSTLGWIPIQTELLEHAPNVIFNYLMLFEILLYSLAIGEKTIDIFNEKSLLQKQVINSELTTLRSQINPHFLFNSLNSIKDLISKKQNIEATDYITDFADLVRKILENSKETMISMADELAFLETYLQLENRRNHKLNYTITTPENLDLEQNQIPAMLLQPIVENAVKHAFDAQKDELLIDIEVRDFSNFFEITIKDNGIGYSKSLELKKNQNKHKSLGMELTQSRLQLIKELYNWEIKLQITENNGTIVALQIPHFC